MMASATDSVVDASAAATTRFARAAKLMAFWLWTNGVNTNGAAM